MISMLPNMAETRLKLKKPIRPQFMPPIIIRINISCFKIITPFACYFALKIIFYTLYQADTGVGEFYEY
ncbi:MAG: hypothetical protein DBY08_04080 [Clostridiales bacterium]|nr:MAG: hypothetical protein DBY08_04080 [Clostridiales bacterium]